MNWSGFHRRAMLVQELLAGRLPITLTFQGSRRMGRRRTKSRGRNNNRDKSRRIIKRKKRSRS